MCLACAKGIERRTLVCYAPSNNCTKETRASAITDFPDRESTYNKHRIIYISKLGIRTLYCYIQHVKLLECAYSRVSVTLLQLH